MADPIGLIDEGRYEEAWELLEREPGADPVRLCHRARAAWEGGRDEEAWSSVARAAESAPSHAFVLQSRGLLSLDAGRFAEARTLLDQALAASPGNVVLPAYRGLALFLEGREAEGLEALERSLLPVPASLQSRVALHLEGWLGPGVATFGRCVLEVDEEPEPAVFAAVNKYLVMPEDVAEQIHLHLFDRGRLPAVAAIRRAGARMASGDAAAAVAELRSAPASDEVSLVLAEVLLATGDAAGALPILESLCRVEERHPFTDAFRCAALFKVGRAVEAVDLLPAAMEVPQGDGTKVGDDFSVGYLHGLALLAAGRPREARRAFEAAFRRECPFAGKVLLAACRARLAGPQAPVQ